jgi:signal transduction histidine kinase
MWAVPLWSERGLIGVLLLGEKQDGGLYAQEEIEIARASGERLIDTQAGAEMARRLMTLQRQRLAETQVVDRQTRRVLHDDVLPQLHAALLTLSSKIDPNDEPTNESLSSLSNVHRQISNLLHEIPATTTPQIGRLGLIGALQQTVADEFTPAFDDVNWEIEMDAEDHSKTIPTLTAEVVFYAAREAIRNAARHGRADEAQSLVLKIIVLWSEGLEIIIEDNGVGLNASPKESSQRSGKGLALHSTMMSVIGGTLAVESVPNKYTRVRLSLPQSDYT